MPKGEIRGPYTLPSQAYPGTQHTYWVYVPAQYDPAVPAALMVFQDGQAFKDEKGDMRAQNVMDNLIYRREIPVMIGVFINPGRRPDQPEPTPRNWGDRDTNRPTEYNSLDDKYARVITEELMPALAKDYNISKDPEMHGIGGSSSGAIAAFTVAWERPDHFRKVLSNVGSFVNLRGGHVYPEKVLAAEKKPIRVYLCDGRNDNRGLPQRQVRRDAGLVLPERAADEGPHAEGVRRELLVGHEQPRAEVRRGDPAGDDAVAVARRSGVHRPERHGGAGVQPAGCGEELEADRARAVDRSRRHQGPIAHRLFDYHDSTRPFPAFVPENLGRTGGDDPARRRFAPGANRARPVGRSSPTSAPSALRSATCCRRRWTCRPATAAASTCSGWIATTGALTPAGIHEMGTSPSCLALNAAGTRLYSANETDRVGDDKEGTVSAFAIDRADGQLTLLNTVRSGGAGPTYVSVHPSGRFVLVANYFGGSVAVLPILPDGRLGDATDVKNDAGKIGPARATNAPPGSFAFSGHDRTHAHMIQADPAGRFVLHADLGLDRIFVWKFDEPEGRC